MRACTMRRSCAERTRTKLVRSAHVNEEGMRRALATLALLLLITPPARSADLAAGATHAFDSEPTYLKVDEAFRLAPTLGADGVLTADWQIADGYHLYRHRFAFAPRPEGAVALGAPVIPAGEKQMDEVFGEVEVYYHAVSVRVPVAATASSPATFEVGISYQGCADKGLCYPPQTRWFSYRTAMLASAAQPAVEPVDVAAKVAASVASTAAEPVTEEQGLARDLEGDYLAALLRFFGLGILLAFTPCVFPMVPILSSIIVGQGQSATRLRSFTLSLAYVLGMAVTYAALGVVVGLFGARMNLQAAVQSPPVLIGFAIVFVLLALSMFGFYELRLPRFVQDRLDAASSRQSGGKHAGVVAMGALSALVVSPCVSAPLAGALIYLGTTGNAWLGGSALLVLGLGMGTPLLIVGAGGGHLLPRAGAWMETVKAVFGVSLLAVAIWLLDRVVPPAASLALWSALAIGTGVYLGALDFSPRKGWGQLWKATGAFSFLYGVLLLIGAASGARDPLAPLATFASGGERASSAAAANAVWRPVKGVAGLDAALADAVRDARPAVLDFYADWCISCKVMERTVFSDPEVGRALARYALLRSDVTANDASDQALLERFDLSGPPSLVFFDANGRELSQFRIQGEKDKAEFLAHLEKLDARAQAVAAR